MSYTYTLLFSGLPVGKGRIGSSGIFIPPPPPVVGTKYETIDVLKDGIHRCFGTSFLKFVLLNLGLLSKNAMTKDSVTYRNIERTRLKHFCPLPHFDFVIYRLTFDGI